ncbi:tape measure chaperone [Acinetobacter phage DMU1]|nr:tape measure chaperone [Acinetobacter phage DMU1]
MSMDKFFTREKSNEGIKLPLPLPSGLPSGDHLVIVGKYSDLYRTNEADMKRRAVEICSKYPDDKKKRTQLLLSLEIEFLASLVIGWSFEQEFNKKNIEMLLREAPQIMDLVDKSVMNNSLFFFRGKLDELFESCRRTFELEKVPKGSKTSIRKHLEQVKKQTGNTPQQLRDLPPPPEELDHILDWYYQVAGTSRLTWVELQAWSDITKTLLKPYEAEAIMAIDRIYWSVING